MILLSVIFKFKVIKIEYHILFLKFPMILKNQFILYYTS